jgi:very-short-patch-repair endonuclease
VAKELRRRAEELASTQHGVVASHQLRTLGLTSAQVGSMVDNYGWERVSGLVLLRRGSTPDARQRVSAAVLDAGPGAALSHESAAAWMGHRGSRLERPVHASTTRKLGRRNTLARIHEVRSLPAEFLIVHDGVTTVCAEMVALHVFATMRPERAARIIDSMWSRRMLSGRTIGRFLALFAKQGRNGIVALRAYYEERGDDYTPPDSGLEARTLAVLADAGLKMRRQVWVGDHERSIGRVDLAHPDLPLLVEVQSEMHHSSFSDRARDEVRLADLRTAGWTVVEIPEEWVWTDPALVVLAVREGIRQATAIRHAG